MQLSVLRSNGAPPADWLSVFSQPTTFAALLARRLSWFSEVKTVHHFTTRVNGAGQTDKAPMWCEPANGAAGDWTLMECRDKLDHGDQSEAREG